MENLSSVTSILFITDDLQSQQLVRRILSNKGYRVLTAPKWSTGITLATETEPNLVLIDFDLPDIGGNALAARLRSLPEPDGDDPRIDYQEARAARSLSDYARQLEAAERAITKARAFQASQLVASGHVLAGQAHERLGDVDQAMASFMDARRLFDQTGPFMENTTQNFLETRISRF